MNTVAYMAVAFVLGAALRGFKEYLRYRYLVIALREPMSEVASARLKEALSVAPRYVRWRLMLLLLLWPDRFIKEAHQLADRTLPSD
jgi:hypothetical protein